ncbi:PqqD family protein [Micromonospora carbonacea]|uniref:Coenzyme PQQ synthesis protein D (PqqD) n=1 Tax=Micromonospora carbonacea TaxID=47853 RepID=A0A1C4Z1A1_9ACTN|nr:PqqD family protein [Micromonospora carbonacea]SCF26832.1 Coenzyme PQQ synthesis protein D (PqqD) [Micromonospora carbonacea]
MNSDESIVYKVRGDRVAWRISGDETVLLDTGRSVYFALDRCATSLWPHLVAGATAAQLAEVLAGQAAVQRDRAAADVRSFLADLEAADLLERI